MNYCWVGKGATLLKLVVPIPWVIPPVSPAAFALLKWLIPVVSMVRGTLIWESVIFWSKSRLVGKMGGGNAKCLFGL